MFAISFNIKNRIKKNIVKQIPKKISVGYVMSGLNILYK